MLIAHMTGRNEDEQYLETVLEMLMPLVDRVVYTDDCSWNSSPYIAETMGADVMQTYSPITEEDESLFRSLAWEHLSSYANYGDWIFAIRPDEIFIPSADFADLLDQSSYSVIGVTVCHMWNAYQFRLDGDWIPLMHPRIFRYLDSNEYLPLKTGCPLEPLYVQEMVRRELIHTELGGIIQRYSLAKDEDKIKTYKKLTNQNPGLSYTPYQVDSILQEDPLLVDWKT